MAKIEAGVLDSVFGVRKPLTANREPRTERPRPFLDSPREAEENMRLDRALFAARKPALRIYGWKGRAVSLGYFQRQEEVRRSLPGDWKESPIVMRPTGGGAVLHTTRETTFCLVLPAAAIGNPLSSYRAIHVAVQRALLGLGIRTELAQQKMSGTFCFMAPTPGDLLLEGCKIVGGAQRRSRGWLLHQGSIQLPLAPSGLRRALSKELAKSLSLCYIQKVCTPQSL